MVTRDGVPGRLGADDKVGEAMVKTKSCVCVPGQVVVLRWDQRFSQFFRYPTGLFRPRKPRAVEADLLWRIGGRDRTGTMRLADCCVQGRPRSEGYRWVRRATKRTRRLAKSSRFGTRTGSIQEQTGIDRIGHSSGGGGRWFPGLLIPRGNLMPAHGRPSRNIRHGGAGREAARPQRIVSRDGRASPSRDSSCPQAAARAPWLAAGSRGACSRRSRAMAGHCLVRVRAWTRGEL